MSKEDDELLIKVIDAMPPLTPLWVPIVTFIFFGLLIVGVVGMELGWWL